MTHYTKFTDRSVAVHEGMGTMHKTLTNVGNTICFLTEVLSGLVVNMFGI